MIHIHVVLTVRNLADVDKVRGLLKEHATASRAEPGCRRFELYQSESDPGVFVLDESYDSTRAVEEHRLGRTFREIYQPRILPLVERISHVCAKIE